MASVDDRLTLSAVPRTDADQLAAVQLRDRLLVALSVSSGAVDAISFLVLGKVFTAFMTGNLVFLAIGATGAGGPDVLPVCVSLAAFSAGVVTAQRVAGDATDAGVWPTSVTTVLGLAATAQLVFLALWAAVSGNPASATVDALLALSAFAMGLQSGAVRSLNVAGVFTTAATATVIVLMTDLAARSRASERMRLEGVIAGLVAGAAAGGLVLIHARSYAAVLPLAATVGVIGVAASAAVLRPRSSR
jgi:uncharacterized membrane protein YoaK (UPF0700 family)